ncbi:uncharacterized protein LOC116330566 [Oreochromis aureus]|uniref:uncharacterized protein LOC116330566 n=1 Tax=Oreochromis aureus TaxID=47969 RepID=UPI0019548599|nr:uncharacterized protein LOC116330566 [Oreochromis aureus]
MSGEDDDHDYSPGSDEEFKEGSSDESSHSDPESPVSEEPLQEEQNSKSENYSGKDKGVTPVKRKPMISQAEASQTPVLPAVKRPNSKARFYDKKNYCLFCSKPVLKLSRHFESIHSDKPEVAAAFQYPKHSKERQNIWKKLTNEGNFAHNKNVLKTGEGTLVVRQRPKVLGQARDFLPCLHCHGLFVKRNLFKHMRTCPAKSKIEKDIGKKRIASMCVLATLDCEDRGISDVARGILNEMIYDDVTRAVMDDRILLQFGEYMYNHYGRDAKKHPYIRQNLRQIARLVLEAQKTTPMKKLEDFFHPSNFQRVVSAVNVLAGYDSETKIYAAPSVAIKLGHSLQKTCSIVKDNAVKSGDTKQAEAAKNFLSVYQKKWTKLVSSAALRSLREIKSKRAKQIPLVQDMKRLHFHLEKVHTIAEKNLRDSLSTENFVALARVMLARIILFNKRKPREVATIQLTEFMSRTKSDPPDDLDPSVTELEKTMCRFFTRVDVRGDCGRKVPVLLKPSFESALELLVDSREACGITSKNPFVFARPNALSNYRGTDCLQGFIKECGAQNSEGLTSKNVRKHFAKMLQLMNLDENEANQIFGPNNKIQILRQCNDSTLDDIEMDSEAESWDHSEGRPASLNQQKRGGKSANKSIRGSKCTPKHAWGDAEVRAVEKHMMRFIQEHKVPQKDDCVKCLEAEAKALRNRTWKGLKNYVRNRITTLKRQSDSSQDSPTSSKRTREAEPQKTRQPTSGRQADSQDHDEGSTADNGEAPFNHQNAHGETRSASKTTRPKSVKSGGQGSFHKTKHTWEEAEVHAVERHMMSFIQEHKVPQKDDCMKCLDAEPRALRNRTWKGVKDYVRNRITTLQRQSGFSLDSPKSRKRPRKSAEPQQSGGAEMFYHQQEHEETTSSSKTSRSVKSSEKGFHHKTKHTWEEAEVHAVERHMMSFIQGHKVPQKDDCIRCLDAEPRALRNRSWKGVKDYVRNRITTLQRQSDCFQDSPKSRKRPRKSAGQQSTPHYQQL